MEVAVPHPAGCLRCIDRLNRAKYHIGTACLCFGKQVVEPERLHRLVVIDKGEEIGIRRVQAVGKKTPRTARAAGASGAEACRLEAGDTPLQRRSIGAPSTGKA